MSEIEIYPFPTLPDYLAPGMRLVFVGINPAVYAVQKGHYFARGSNRFWPALSRSLLSLPIREALGRDRLSPEDDARLLPFGIGFTDVVKRPTRNASELSPSDYMEWAPRLMTRLDAFRPRVACFNGITGYAAFARYVLAEPKPVVALGPQTRPLGETHLFVVPSPSGANAHFTLQDQIAWYDRLADFLGDLDQGPEGIAVAADFAESEARQR